MCRRAGNSRLDVPACRPAWWFRDRMVIPDGLVRYRRPGHRFGHEPPAHTVTGWKEVTNPTEDFQAGDERPTWTLGSGQVEPVEVHSPGARCHRAQKPFLPNCRYLLSERQ
jgi:hypothetical protein